ncbi:MAG: hypothetical protein J7M20_09135 [Deltaproteobacteria bacterium]|nr:hypothetical protein [Deltaproteobacteria bacterium]
MMRVGANKFNVCLMCVGLMVMVFWGEVQAASAELTVRPDGVRIGTWYDGAKLHVHANIPRGCQAVLPVWFRENTM